MLKNSTSLPVNSCVPLTVTALPNCSFPEPEIFADVTVVPDPSVVKVDKSFKAPERVVMLKQMYEEEFQRAADQDEDRASFRIAPYKPGL